MDFNVSSMKNTTSQNSINTCMKSIKTIIKNYKPLDQSKDEYAIFEYEGEIPTKPIDLEYSSDRSFDVIGNAGGAMFLAGRVTNDKFVPNKNAKASSYSYTKETKTRTFPTVKKEVVTEYPPTEGSVESLSSYTHEGYRPFIAGNQYYAGNEVIYNPTYNQNLLDIFCPQEEIQLWSKEIEDKYGPGITINKLYSSFLDKNPKYIKLQGIANPSGGKVALYFYVEDKSSWIEIYTSDFSPLLFSRSDTGSKVYGKPDETIRESHSKEPTWNNDSAVYTTKDTNIYKHYTSVRNIGNNTYRMEYYVDEIKTTFIETWKYIPLKNISIRQVYLINRKKYGLEKT